MRIAGMRGPQICLVGDTNLNGLRIMNVQAGDGRWRRNEDTVAVAGYKLESGITCLEATECQPVKIVR